MGRLVAIEGIDGSGKGTQAALLRDRLQADGLKCELLSFPRYRETRFGARIGDFLNGRYGSLDQVNPFLVTLLFSGDRFESRPVLQTALEQNDVVICDRYVASNIAHQAAKLPESERQELIDWVHYVEYDLYSLPRATETLFLDVPVRQAQQLIAQKARRSYTDRAADLQEADSSYLGCVHAVYSRLARADQWLRIECLEGDRLRSPESISNDLVNLLQRQPEWPVGSTAR